MRVLFIGNSATYMHDMPKTFARISGAETDSLTKGGCVRNSEYHTVRK